MNLLSTPYAGACRLLLAKRAWVRIDHWGSLHRRSWLNALFAVAAPSLWAADSIPAAPVDNTLQRVEVRSKREQGTSSEPRSTLRGPVLSNRLDNTLGGTLQSELGVANASFGPSVGVPVVRGQSGSRMRAMVGGLGTHDASTISADHGVMVESGLAESITVLRGPATIRYGGSAIGGAIEIEDGRIPRETRDRVDAQGILRAGRGDMSMGLLKLDGPVIGNGDNGWVWHADAHRRRQGWVPIRGLAIDEAALRQQFQLINTVNTRGRIGNSDSVAEGGALGLSKVGAWGHVGFSLSRLTQDYGIPPGGHSHSHGAAPGEPAPTDDAVRIRARQHRLDVRAEARVPAAWLPGAQRDGTLRVRAARSLYHHDEREGRRLSTTVDNNVSELSVELDQRWHAQLTGTWGLQWQQRTFSGLGEEAFVPRTDVRGGALFALHRWQADPWLLELGLRIEHQHYEPAAGFEVLGQARDFPVRTYWPRSASASVRRSYSLTSDSGGALPGAADPLSLRTREGSITLTHWRVARAPDVQELYAGGPHIATRTFDFGNSALGLETLHAWDLGWTHRDGPFAWRINVFAYDSKNYIYQRSLGFFYEVEERLPQAVCARLDRCLPATKREQSPARFHGYEAELTHEWRQEGGRWLLGVFSDAVRGRLVDGSDVPRLAPQRYGLLLESSQGDWFGQARLTRARAQRRPGENETPTAAFTRLDASLRWTPSSEAVSGHLLTLFVVGRNLSNQAIRNSSSFLRSYAPEPGRSIELGLELSL